jgi:hypothetical protein
MAPVAVRRAGVIGLVLALAASGAAFADTILGDGDSVDTGAQQSRDLGDLTPGETLSFDVSFVLTCKNMTHVAAGSTISVPLASTTVPEGGSATATAGSIDVPADWPVEGDVCLDSGLPTTTGATASHVEITAPTVVGTGYEYVLEYGPDPVDGITNLTFFTVTLNVVEGGPQDTVPPTLAGMPGDITVTTAGTDAVVTWSGPTATDDTDPNPAVSCAPPSGSTFGLGTWLVTCTAQDASGNDASASFHVTVNQEQAPTGAFGRPLGDGVPSLTANQGRTIPLKLTVAGDFAGAPTLRLERLDACAAEATALATRSGGGFAWGDAGWQLNLATSSMAGGCWRLVALAGSTPVATAVIRLTPDAAPAKAPKH